MAYNKAKEEYRWNQWKAEEEKILREQGVDEETIQKLREYDWNDFNAERRFREHQTSLLDCMELLLEEKNQESLSQRVWKPCSIPWRMRNCSRSCYRLTRKLFRWLF